MAQLTKVFGDEGTIRHRTMHGYVVEALGRDILNGTYASGTALPPEPALCTALGVSRGAVREAVKALSAKGLLESRPRTGTRVRSRSEWNLLDEDMLLWQEEIDAVGLVRSLNEMRRIIEPGVAELAALRMTTQDIERLTRAMDAMDRASGDEGSLASFTDADVAFHTIILESCDNPLFHSLSRPLHTALHIGFSTTSTVPGAVASTLPLHRLVLEAITGRNPGAAAEAMRRLIDTAENDLNEVVTRSSPRPRKARVPSPPRKGSKSP